MLLLVLAAAVSDPGTADLAEAYRLDSLQTKALNLVALGQLAPTQAATARSPGQPLRVSTAAELDLAAREQRAVQAWRTRQAECEAGKKASCD